MWLESLYNIEAVQTVVSPSIDYKTDSDGFRNPSDIASAELVAIGDSFTNGAYVQRNEIWSVRAAGKRGMTEIDLAAPGYAPQQAITAFEKYGLPRKPKLVLFQIFYGNDIDDAARFERWKRSKKSFYEFTRLEIGELPPLFLTS